MNTTTETRLIGRVKCFDPRRGYGFIAADNQDYFAHVTNIVGDFEIMENDEVSFSVSSKNGRRKAINIRILNK